MRGSAYQLIIALWAKQIGLLSLLVVVLWFFDAVIAYSVLVGGLVHWVPNAYLALVAFRHYGTQQHSAVVVQSFYKGEAGKFLLTAVGFSIVFVFVKPLSYWVVFVTYLGMTITHWLFVSHWSGKNN
ncbi:MAG: ATP synthase protein I [Cellvibrionaceae bacterium]|jgi:ATP synthase protein I